MPAVIGSIFGAQLAITLPEQLFNTTLAVILVLSISFMFFDSKRIRKQNSAHKPNEKHLVTEENIEKGEDSKEGSIEASKDKQFREVEISSKNKISKGEEKDWGSKTDPTKIYSDIWEEVSTKRKIILFIVFLLIGFYGGYIQGGVGFIIIGALVVLTNFSLLHINAIKIAVIGIYSAISLFVFIKAGKVDWLIAIFLAAGNFIGGWLGSRLAIEKGERFVRVFLSIVLAIMAGRLLWISI